MKKIRVIKEKSAAIELALAAVNGKGGGHCYTNAIDIMDIADWGEKRLSALGIRQKDMIGAQVFACSGEAVAKAYKWSRKATRVVLERRSSGWFLISAAATEVYTRGGSVSLAMTAAQDAVAVERFRRGYLVQKAVVSEGQ